MQVGDKVVFVGPEYIWSPQPIIGDRGIITHREGVFSQAGENHSTELVVVKFHNHDKPTVVGIHRLKEDK
jgi:hypothetical protein